MTTGISIKELYWAAGFIEGEGYFGYTKDKRGNRKCVYPRIIVAQKELEPLERLSSIFSGAKVYRAASGVSNWTLHGKKAIGVMMTLWPLMASRRQKQIENTIRAWKQNRPHGYCGRTVPREPNGTFAG